MATALDRMCELHLATERQFAELYLFLQQPQHQVPPPNGSQSHHHALGGEGNDHLAAANTSAKLSSSNNVSSASEVGTATSSIVPTQVRATAMLPDPLLPFRREVGDLTMMLLSLKDRVDEVELQVASASGSGRPTVTTKDGGPATTSILADSQKHRPPASMLNRVAEPPGGGAPRASSATKDRSVNSNNSVLDISSMSSIHMSHQQEEEALDAGWNIGSEQVLDTKNDVKVVVADERLAIRVGRAGGSGEHLPIPTAIENTTRRSAPVANPQLQAVIQSILGPSKVPRKAKGNKEKSVSSKKEESTLNSQPTAAPSTVSAEVSWAPVTAAPPSNGQLPPKVPTPAAPAATNAAPVVAAGTSSQPALLRSSSTLSTTSSIDFHIVAEE